MAFTLRQNQEDTINALIDYVMNPANNGKSPLISAPVAFGKSICIAEFPIRMIYRFPNNNLRFLNLVHTKELVDQNYKKFKQMTNSISCGVYMDSLGKKDTEQQVIYGSMQSVSKDPSLFSPHFLIVDECHWINKKDTGSYRGIINAIKEKNPNLVVIGWTGTEWRMDGGPLAEGHERLFDDVYYADTIKGMLEKGYHSPLITPFDDIQNRYENKSNIKEGKSVTALEKSDAAMMDDHEKIEAAVDEYRRLSMGRRKHLVFGSTTKHREHLTESMSRYYRVVHVHGKMSKKDREKAILDYNEDRLDMLVSGVILTTGFDEPRIDCLGLFRTVASSALYIQIAGRGLRIHGEKENCLWLDFTSTTEIHGPVDEVKAPPYIEKVGAGEAIKKICGECGEFVYASVRICPYCDTEFEIISTVGHEENVQKASIMSKPPEWKRIASLKFERYECKKTKKPKLIAKFSFGLVDNYTKILDFEGNGRYYACQFWEALCREERWKKQCPTSRENALSLIYEQNALHLAGDILFTGETHYMGPKGRTKLSTPRMVDVLGFRGLV